MILQVLIPRILYNPQNRVIVVINKIIATTMIAIRIQLITKILNTKSTIAIIARIIRSVFPTLGINAILIHLLSIVKFYIKIIPLANLFSQDVNYLKYFDLQIRSLLLIIKLIFF